MQYFQYTNAQFLHPVRIIRPKFGVFGYLFWNSTDKNGLSIA